MAVDILCEQVRSEHASDKVASNVEVVKIVLEETRDLNILVRPIESERKATSSTHIDGTNVDGTVDEIVPNFQFPVIVEEISWYTAHCLWWIPRYGFVMQTFRSVGIENKHGRLSSWSNTQSCYRDKQQTAR